MEHTADGSILNVGRRTRTIPPALRRALEARDRGCRFPGCGLRFTDGHHLIHWADGGETSLDNCILLCLHHHRLVHEGDWSVQWWGHGRPVFFDPRGGTHFEGRWKPPVLEEDGEELGERSQPLEERDEELEEHPVQALIHQNHRHGARPDGRTAGIRWKREQDIPDDLYFRALEAMDHALWNA